MSDDDIIARLKLAVCAGRTEEVKDLLISFSIPNSVLLHGGYDLLLQSLDLRFTDIAKLLLENDARVNCNDRQFFDGITPLHLAARDKNVEIVKMLLSRNCEINAKTVTDCTPLHYAVENQSVEVVQMILDKNPKVNSQNFEGFFPLHLAVEKNNFSIIKMLLDRGANVNAYHPSGWSPLHGAVDSCNKEIIKLLLDQGAYIDAGLTNFYFNCTIGFRPLHLAINKWKKDLVELLLSYGASLEHANGQNMIHFAAKKGNSTIVECFLQNYVSVNCINEYTYQTPLHIGSHFGNVPILRILLKYGAYIDVRTNDGLTPLHMGCQCQNKLVIEFLLINGADINALCKENKTPLQYVDTEDLKVIIKRQIIMNSSLNMYVSESNLKAVINEDNSFKKYCEAEVALMKLEMIEDSSVSVYNLLKRSVNQLAQLLKNDNLAQNVKSIDFKTKFPIFSEILYEHLYRGKMRVTLLKQYHDYCYNIFPSLHSDCVDKILDYLTNQDLMVLIFMCKFKTCRYRAMTNILQ